MSNIRVISMKRLRKFWNKYPDAQLPLRSWYKIALSANWNNLQEVRMTYANSDGVKTKNGEDLTVFNICGNKYRLIARIKFPHQLVNVRAVLTHNEYDKGAWKE